MHCSEIQMKLSRASINEAIAEADQKLLKSNFNYCSLKMDMINLYNQNHQYICLGDEYIGDDPLAFACAVGDFEIVQKLLDKGYDPNRCKEKHLTPLMIASYQGYYGIVRNLINHGANLRIFSGGAPMNALKYAVYKGHADIVKLLLDRGASLERGMVNALSVFTIAEDSGHPELIELLKKY